MRALQSVISPSAIHLQARSFDKVSLKIHKVIIAKKNVNIKIVYKISIRFENEEIKFVTSIKYLDMQHDNFEFF